MPTSRSGGRHPQGTYPASAFPSTNLYVSPFENTGHDPSNSPGPRSQQTPEVVLTEAEHDSDEEEDSSSSRSEDEDNAGGAEGSKSAAERLAEKRRMKRFRLNHVQTRYLMNEFARQPHPDAAQRERLSREIPGLKPRQVQVWFQNRRAKMKRLTTDDQERMMRSRALPEDFDLSSTLHPESRRPSLGSVPSLSNLNLTETGASQRPTLTLNQDYGNVQHGSMSAVCSSYSPITGSVTGSRNLSPVSPYSGSHYSASPSPVTPTSGHNQLGRSNSFSTGSQASQYQSGLSAPPGMGRRRPESFAFSEQSNALAAGSLGAYGGQDQWSLPQAAPQPLDNYGPRQLQHSSTFPAVTNASSTYQTISPLTSPNPLLYDQPQASYPQAATNPAYYSASYTQNFEISGSWQNSYRPTPAGGNPQYQPRAAGFSSNPDQYTQIPNQSGQIAPSVQYTASQPTVRDQPLYPSSSRGAPSSTIDRRRGRGNTYSSSYNQPQ